MDSLRRKIARILAAVTVVGAVAAFSQVVTVRQPAFATLPSTGSEAETALAVARANCHAHARATWLDQFSRGDAGETLRSACSRLPPSAAEASDSAVGAVTQAHYAMRFDVADRKFGAMAFLLVLSFAAAFAVAGFGRTGAVLALLVLVVPAQTGVYLAIPVGIVAALVFLAAARFGERPPVSRPHASLATLVVLVLVPACVTMQLFLGFGDFSLHPDERLRYTTAGAVVAWTFAGVPLAVLIHRARADAARDASLAAPLRIGFASLVLVGLIVATAVAQYGAMRTP